MVLDGLDQQQDISAPHQLLLLLLVMMMMMMMMMVLVMYFNIVQYDLLIIVSVF